jgi:hypothetical protein
MLRSIEYLSCQKLVAKEPLKRSVNLGYYLLFLGVSLYMCRYNEMWQNTLDHTCLWSVPVLVSEDIGLHTSL